MLLGDHRPPVRQDSHVPAPGREHRLDREGHSRLELEPAAGFAVVQDLWILVIDAPDAVTAVLAHDREVARLGEGLDRVTDITQVSARAHLLDATPHRLEAT